MNRSTIVDLESGKREPHDATLTVLMNELAAAGIVFTAKGVEFPIFDTFPAAHV